MGYNRFSLLLPLLVVLTVNQVACQDNPLYRFHFMHPILLNPAITGSEFLPVANLSFQKQWAGFPGSPATLLASGTFRIGEFDFYNPQKLINTSTLKSRERIGLGMALFSDRNGPAIHRGLNLAYAYHLPLATGCLSLGLGGSAKQRIMDGTEYRPSAPDDPLLPPVRESMMLWIFHLGAYYYSAGLFGGCRTAPDPREEPVPSGAG